MGGVAFRQESQQRTIQRLCPGLCNEGRGKGVRVQGEQLETMNHINDYQEIAREEGAENDNRNRTYLLPLLTNDIYYQ